MLSLGSVNVQKLKDRNQLYQKRNKSMPCSLLYSQTFQLLFAYFSNDLYVQKFPQIGIDFVKNYFT
jgi:hypothetical protein